MVMAAEMSSEPTQPNRFEKKKNNSQFPFARWKGPERHGACPSFEGLEMQRRSRHPVEPADYRMQQRNQFRDHYRKGSACGLQQPRQGVRGRERPRPRLRGLWPGDPA